MQCTALARALAAYGPAVVVTSPEPKAAETAQIVADLLGTPLEIVEDLREHDRRNVPWMKAEDFRAAVGRFFQEPQSLVLGQESADQAYRRFAAAVNAVIHRHPTETVAMVTHGTVMTLYVAGAEGLDPFTFWKSLGMPALAVLSLPGRRLLTVIEQF
jgi:broad specificity phosphatase PhoE